MRPQIIFFDAVGTLFGVRGTVGQIYGQFAQQAGLNINEQDLDRAFIQSFKAAPRAAFLEASPTDLLTLEYQWWRAIAHQVSAKWVQRPSCLILTNSFNRCSTISPKQILGSSIQKPIGLISTQNLGD